MKLKARNDENVYMWYLLADLKYLQGVTVYLLHIVNRLS
jgi:hypothetical protein